MAELLSSVLGDPKGDSGRGFGRRAFLKLGAAGLIAAAGGSVWWARQQGVFGVGAGPGCLVPGERFDASVLHVAADMAPQTQIFYSLYFAMTGLHALHMIIGMGILLVIAVLAWRGRFTPQNHNLVEGIVVADDDLLEHLAHGSGRIRRDHLLALGRLDLAIETLQDALDIEPGEAILHYNLACYWSLANNVQLALDFLALTALVWLMGGARSPFLAFYLLHVILAAVLLSPREAAVSTITAYGLLAGLVIGE